MLHDRSRASGRRTAGVEPDQSTTAVNAPGNRDTRGGPRLHTPAQAAALLTVPESWLRRQAGRRRIPCTFLGRHLRFSDSDLATIIVAGAQPANSSRRRPPRPRRS